MENSDSNWNHQIKAYKFLMEFYTFRHGDYDDCVPSKCSTRWFDDDVLQVLNFFLKKGYSLEP